MTYSKLASRTAWTSDGSSRDGAQIDRFIVHHAATTSKEAILELFRPGGRVVSANYALGSDGELIATVEEQYRAWTSASYVDDRRAVTIEVANSQAGGAWPVSDAAFDKLARLIADVADRYGFPINDDTVLTHQELYTRFGRSYATACPGDLQRRKPELLDRARSYQGKATTGSGGSKPAPAKPKPKPKPNAVKPTKAPKFPLPKGYYFGPKDGPVQSVSGYFPLPPMRTSDVQKHLWRWQQRMEDRGWKFPKYGSDGMYGDETRENVIAFQREKGLTVDGLLGPDTWNAAWSEPVT